MRTIPLIAMGLCMTGLLFLETTMAVEAPAYNPTLGDAAREVPIETVLAWWGEATHVTTVDNLPVDVELVEGGVLVVTSTDQPTDVPLPGFEDPDAHRRCWYHSHAAYSCCYYNDHNAGYNCYEYTRQCYRSNGETYCYYRAREYYC